MSSQDVKDEIDAQSGRFEFLKQALTLGLAGLAGTAAIFTDSSKIPSDRSAIIAVSAIGATLLTLVGSALMGLSVYANLLKAHATNAAVANFRDSLILHAKLVFASIIAVALSFVIYAGLQIAHRGGERLTSVEAIGIARKALAATGCDARFESLVHGAGGFDANFQSDACRRGFVVRVEAHDGSVTIKSI